MRQISNFGARLREYRAAQGLTLEELAQRARFSAQTLNRYELGQRVPKIDTAVAIAAGLGVHPLWLQGFDVAPDAPCPEEGGAPQEPLAPELLRVARAYAHATARDQAIVRAALGLDASAETPPSSSEARVAAYGGGMCRISAADEAEKRRRAERALCLDEHI